MSYMPSRKVVLPELVAPSMVKVRSGTVTPASSCRGDVSVSEARHVGQELVQALDRRNQSLEIGVGPLPLQPVQDGALTPGQLAPPAGHKPAEKRVPVPGRLGGP